MQQRTVLSIGPYFGLTNAERERFTLLNLVNAVVHDDKQALADFRRLSDQVAVITGQQCETFHSFLLPADTLGWMQRRDLTAGVANAGGRLVDTRIEGFANALARQSIIGNLPVLRLQNMSTNVLLTGESVRATAGWVYEGQVAPTAESTLGQIAMTPKTCCGELVVSRMLQRQMGPAAGAFLEANLGAQVAEAADAALLVGTGASGQPLGIAVTPGIDSRTGTSFAWTDATAMLRVCDGYAQGESIAWVAGVDSAKVLRDRERSAGSGFIADDDRIANKPMLVSRGASASSLTVTEWGKVWVADWGALEIQIDPFTNFQVGKVRIKARWLIDVSVERPALVATATAVT